MALEMTRVELQPNNRNSEPFSSCVYGPQDLDGFGALAGSPRWQGELADGPGLEPDAGALTGERSRVWPTWLKSDEAGQR
jgi:hypothetical protein